MRYMMNAMRMNLRRAAQYRASFLMQICSQIVMTGGDLWAMLMLLERYGRMGHWEGREILFFFGAMHLVFSVTEMINRGLGHFGSSIRSGAFDTMLTRPRRLLTQVLLSELDPRRVGTMAVGITAMAVGTALIGIEWTVWKVLLLLWSMAATVCLMLGLFLLEAVICFFSVQSIEMVNILTYGGRQTCQYPVDLYPDFIRILFTYVVPVALCLQYPVSRVLGRPMAVGIPDGLLWFCPLAGPGFLALMTLFWRFGVRRYRSTGS